MPLFFLWLDSYWGRHWNKLGILLAPSLLGEAGGTKPGCSCQEYAMLKVLESVFKNLLFEYTVSVQDSHAHFTSRARFASCPSSVYLVRKEAGLWCILSFFFLWEENKGLRSEWLLLSKNLFDVSNSDSNGWLKHFNKNYYYLVTCFYLYAEVWVPTGRT